VTAPDPVLLEKALGVCVCVCVCVCVFMQAYVYMLFKRSHVIYYISWYRTDGVAIPVIQFLTGKLVDSCLTENCKTCVVCVCVCVCVCVPDKVSPSEPATA